MKTLGRIVARTGLRQALVEGRMGQISAPRNYGSQPKPNMISWTYFSKRAGLDLCMPTGDQRTAKSN